MKHGWCSSYWAVSTSEDGSIDNSSHCEAARGEKDSTLAEGPDQLLRSSSNLAHIISHDDSLPLSVEMSAHKALA